MRKPRCAEPVPNQSDGHFTGYAACGKEAPCRDHPGGAIDTVRDAAKLQAKWKAAERRKRKKGGGT